MDPFDIHDDARLWDALRRAYLIDSIDETTFTKALMSTKNEEFPEDQKQDDVEVKLEELGVSDAGGMSRHDTFISGMNTPATRFTLDTIIESEGANLSVGERSLLSLARALVKDSRVVVLDEAT